LVSSVSFATNKPCQPSEKVGRVISLTQKKELPETWSWEAQAKKNKN